ncbi:parallel beta-helix domain-containing protein [Parvularcula sp. IMCC14364]|uniref:parallel beta-helix domain-containing protein n=1 Tax=Parvularcula sp. IMCC14364 TaxID=3067902 RepID=UPI0035590598
MRTSIIALTGVLMLAACGQNTETDAGNGEGDSAASTAAADYAATLRAQFLDAQPGDVIEIPAGNYSFDRSLSLSVDNVTIRGAGMDETVLSFKGQVAGAEGLLVTGDNFTIENLAIEDTKGDALKINESKNVVIRGVRTAWNGEPKTSNGAYGMYPVQCENVLIEDSVAIGASDAGIYVGQSRNIIVRRNRVEYNVAGLEIENSIGADVYENIATNNTGGILVFNMPNLPQPGYGTRVYNNDVYENNTRNFGHPGTPVASVPAGSGVVINSNDKVEIFDNRIADNKTANIIISSVYSAGYEGLSTQEDFDPYPEGIFVHGNELSGGGNAPDGLDLKALKTMMFGLNGSFPDVLWDGYVNMDKYPDGVLAGEDRICIDNGDVEVLNVDMPNGNDNPTVDTAQHNCTLERLPAVSLDL